MTKVVVHHLEQSRSQRVLWALEELGVEYTMELHRRHPKTMRAGPSLKAIHPLGRAPVVVIDGEVHAESGAILEGLLDRFDEDHGLRPKPGTEEHRRFRFFLHYAEGSLMPPLLVKLLTSGLTGKRVPALARPLTRAVAAKLDGVYTDPEIENHLRFIDRELRDRDYLCGDEFTAADIQMYFPLQGARGRAGLNERTYPKIAAYLERLEARPAHAASIEKGGRLQLGG